MNINDVLLATLHCFLLVVLCLLFALRDLTGWIHQELDRALQRWQRAASDTGGGSQLSRRVRSRPRPRPRHQRLAWLLWKQLQNRLCQKPAQQHHCQQQREQQEASRSVWNGGDVTSWPLSLTSDYHSDGRDTPGTNRSAAAIGQRTSHSAETSLSSTYSWDAEPSPRSLPSDGAAPRDLTSGQVRSSVGSSGAVSSRSSSASWSSVHESDCECALLVWRGVGRGSQVVARRSGQGAVTRRRSAHERVTVKRRLTYAQRENRRWSEVRSQRSRSRRWHRDEYRSSDDEMERKPEMPSTPDQPRHHHLPHHQLSHQMSFSMTSLQPEGYHTPETTSVRLRAQRPYNSLCRKRKERGAELDTSSHRQSWGSEVSKDAFWQALQPNYDFLMDAHLIDSCKEASGDLTWDAGDVPGLDSLWSFSEFMDQYNELYEWLNQIQEAIYSSPENITDRRLRESHLDEIRRKSYRRTLFTEQCQRLQARHAELREEVGWRLAHLTSKWDTLLHCVRPPSPPSAEPIDPEIGDIQEDIAHEIRCLDRWFRHMDEQLGPISFRLGLRSTAEAAERLKQYQALHDEIKSHQRIVLGVCRLCRQLATSSDLGDPDRRRRLARVADRLEKSWQRTFLHAYEWTCHLEGLLEEFRKGNLPGAEDGYWADEDEQEPLTKIPRLGGAAGYHDDSHLTAAAHYSDTGSFFEDDYLPSGGAMKVLPTAPLANSSPVLTAEKQAEYRETGTQDIGYSSENSAPSSGDSSCSDTPVDPSRLQHELKVTESLYRRAQQQRVRRSPVNTSNVRTEVVTADLNGNTGNQQLAPVPTGGSSGAVSGAVPAVDAAEPEAVGSEPAEQFSASQRTANNCATFYFRHTDTDGEEPGGRRAGDLRSGQGDEEEELYASPGCWPSTSDSSDWLNNSGLEESDLDHIGFLTAQELLSELGEHTGETDSSAMRPTSGCDREIHRLVAEAETLVREDLRSRLPPLDLQQTRAKGRRVREWLRRQHGRKHTGSGAAAVAVEQPTATTANSGQVTDSSCDASGEYTTGESDVETASSVSEDLTCSMVTCHDLGTPTTVIAAPSRPALPSSPEGATPKVTLRNKKRRSSERPWSLHGLTSAGPLGTGPLSVSETALNQILTPTISREQLNAHSSSNTTVSAGPVPSQLPSSASFDSPLWAGRRRPRPRRPITARSSGSEGSPTQARRRRSLRSSGSETERGRVVKSHSFTGTDLRCSLALCPTDTTLVEMSPRASESPRDVIDEPGDVVQAEEASSVSEQAWDPYQEYKPITELGSEGVVDQETVLRLLDDDDYRQYIDSHSDCASSQVSSVRAPARAPPKRSRRKLRAFSDSLDSDTDGEDIQLSVAESLEHLAVVQAEMDRRTGDTSATYTAILATCQSELNRLEQVLILVDPLGLSRDPKSPCYKPLATEVKGVIQKWEVLRAAAMERQRRAESAAALREQIRAFRQAITALDERVSRAGADVTSVDELHACIDDLKGLKQELTARRRRLMSDMATVGAGANGETLKEDVATLCRIWDEVSHRTDCALERLAEIEGTWREFLSAGAELNTDLQADRRKLTTLQRALLTGGDVSDGVQDVAKVLTDRQRHHQQQRQQEAAAAPQTLELGDVTVGGGGSDDLSEGTSGYDSACSDDLSERERRLGRLKRLARNLESVLGPTSQAWNDITNTLSSATSELRDLQQTCRDLVIRTTSQLQLEDTTQPGGTGTASAASPILRRKSYSASRREVSPMGGRCRGAGGRRGWLWRVLRAALPFQLALMLCICVACLLEPHCCDNLNNLAMSLTPQLRYVSGPPPI